MKKLHKPCPKQSREREMEGEREAAKPPHAKRAQDQTQPRSHRAELHMSSNEARVSACVGINT